MVHSAYKQFQKEGRKEAIEELQFPKGSLNFSSQGRKHYQSNTETHAYKSMNVAEQCYIIQSRTKILQSDVDGLRTKVHTLAYSYNHNVRVSRYL
eukprot:879575-Amphidinium_carterae.1